MFSRTAGKLHRTVPGLPRARARESTNWVVPNSVLPFFALATLPIRRVLILWQLSAFVWIVVILKAGRAGYVIVCQPCSGS
jgi:hypothetical protein